MSNNEYTLDRVPRVTMEQVHAARNVIAGQCSTAEDLVLLLDILGIGRIIDPGMLIQ